MKPDLYTKIVLTVIAAMLVCLCLKDAVSLRVVSAQGQERLQKFMLVDEKGNSIYPKHAFPVSVSGEVRVVDPVQVAIATGPVAPSKQPQK
jgi:hypothetical protein